MLLPHPCPYLRCRSRCRWYRPLKLVSSFTPKIMLNITPKRRTQAAIMAKVFLCFIKSNFCLSYSSVFTPPYKVGLRKNFKAEIPLSITREANTPITKLKITPISRGVTEGIYRAGDRVCNRKPGDKTDCVVVDPKDGIEYLGPKSVALGPNIPIRRIATMMLVTLPSNIAEKAGHNRRR